VPTLAESHTAIYRSESGTLVTALAYAQYLLCANTGGENNGLNDSCNIKFQSIPHPDLHFIYPTVTTDAVETKPKSIDFIADWRQFITQNPYGGLFGMMIVFLQNKQGEIRVDDAQKF
jgi:DNA polymerase-3 subunit delta'